MIEFGDIMNEYLLEETVGEQSKRAVVMVGRFNPPTQGHYSAIKLMTAFTVAMGHKVTPIVVVVANDNTSKDLKRNPLSAEDRIKFMTASGNANGVKFITSKTAFDAFKDVRKAGFEPYAIAAGSDRAAKYIELLDKYFTAADGSKLKHIILPGLDERADPDDGVPSEELLDMAENGKEIPIHMMSASMARLAVKLGKKKAFASILGVNQKLADIIFKKVKISLNSPNAEIKK